ncbi:MAG: type II toxin-antitoxin system death-on-curing family toxin [Patescibacteria group bacterium]
MQYLTAEEILILHARVIDETGGSHGVRDLGLLQSIAERPKTAFGGKEMYRGIFTKAAIYLESIVRYHVFIDGNKRTALISTARFLHVNQYELTATNEAVEKYVLKVAVEKPALKEIAVWFKTHSRRRKD